MENTSLKYNADSYLNQQVEGFISDFQDEGYTVLPKVFERESVQHFKRGR